MDKSNDFGDEKAARKNFELDSPQDAHTKPEDVASKAEDIGPNEKTDPTITTLSTDDGVPEVEHEYIRGLKLVLVITAVTLVVFLMMLDMSIIVTVSSPN
jgi:hypothetical protein